MPGKALVVDANILIRAVLGKRVRQIIESNADRVSFFIAEAVYCEAEEHIARLVVQRGGDADKALAFLNSLCRLMEFVGEDMYGEFKIEAQNRRDPEDWPALALALALECPVWTEDTDFFGCGVATWTSDRIGSFFAERQERAE